MKRKGKLLISAGLIAGLCAATHVLQRHSDYDHKMIKVDESLTQANQSFMKMVQESNETYQIIFAGNSYASGYSMKDPVIPLFCRNLQLTSLLKNNDAVEFYQIARP